MGFAQPHAYWWKVVALTQSGVRHPHQPEGAGMLCSDLARAVPGGAAVEIRLHSCVKDLLYLLEKHRLLCTL